MLSDAANPARKTVFQYDWGNRRIREIVDPIDDAIYSTHKSDGLNIIRDFAYDRLGNLIRRATSHKVYTQRQGDLPHYTLIERYGYDLNNRQITYVRGTDAADETGNYPDYVTFALDRASASYVVADVITRFDYDARGNRIRETNGRGRATDYVFDFNDRQIRELRPLVELYSFSIAGSNNGASISARPTTIKRYDNAGNLVQVIDPNGFTTTRYYDGNGRMLAEAQRR